MAGFQDDVLDHIARVIGGTVSSVDARFFSGDKAADGTGVSGLKGCYSSEPGMIQSLPIGIVVPGNFTAELLGGQGKEANEDYLKIHILVAPADQKSGLVQLTPFRDSVPAAFRTHMQAYAAPDVLDCFITTGVAGSYEMGGPGGPRYYAWEFTCRVRRLLSVTYTA